MEIDITKLTNPNEVDLMDYSASNAELGQDAGKITWNNALESEIVFVTTEEEKQEARDWLKEFGAWDAQKIESWNDTELNALILQFIAGDLRAYLSAKEEGKEYFKNWDENHGGRIYESKGKYFYYLGN